MDFVYRSIVAGGLLVAVGCTSVTPEKDDIKTSSDSATIATEEIMETPAYTVQDHIRIQSPDDWQNWNSDFMSMDEMTGSFVVKGTSIGLDSTAFIMIDPSKKTSISGNFKNLSEHDNVIVYLGFKLYDKDFNFISNVHVRVVPETDTELCKPCAPGDTIIYVKDASNWQKDNQCAPVFFTQKDYSDLPNRDCAWSFSQSIQSVTELEDGSFAVQFAMPIGIEADAGVGVRLHIAGSSYMYAGGVKSLVPQEEVSLSAEIKDIVTSGAPRDTWWPGAVYAKAIVLVAGKSADCQVQFDSIDVALADMQ